MSAARGWAVLDEREGVASRVGDKGSGHPPVVGGWHEDLAAEVSNSGHGGVEVGHGDAQGDPAVGGFDNGPAGSALGVDEGVARSLAVRWPAQQVVVEGDQGSVVGAEDLEVGESCVHGCSLLVWVRRSWMRALTTASSRAGTAW